MSKQQILEREARIGPSVGIAGFAGAILFAGSLFLISGSSVGQADSVAAQLRAFNDDSVQFVLGQCLQALALLLLAYVIATLFRAAQVRSSNVLKGMLGLAAIGPALFATSIILTLFGFSAASSDFVDLPEPDVGGTAELTQLKDAIADDPGSIDKIRLLTDADVIEYQTSDGITSIAYPDDEEGELEDSAEEADIDFISDESGEAGELSAQEVVADNSLYNASRTLLLPASLALIAIASTRREAPCAPACRLSSGAPSEWPQASRPSSSARLARSSGRSTPVSSARVGVRSEDPLAGSPPRRFPGTTPGRTTTPIQATRRPRGPRTSRVPRPRWLPSAQGAATTSGSEAQGSVAGRGSSFSTACWLFSAPLGSDKSGNRSVTIGNRAL